MAYETFVSVDYVIKDTIDAHIWFIGGIPVAVVPLITVLDLDEDGLKTAIANSLFSDRRISFDGEIPSTPDDRRGWWGDNLLESGDFMGSRLWTLGQKKMTGDTIIADAEEIIKEALAWMIEDEVTEKIDLQVFQIDLESLGFLISVLRPGEEKATRYFFVWKAVGATANL